MNSRKELFNFAFMAFEWMVGEVKKGREIVSIGPDQDKRILSIPPLTAVANRLEEQSPSSTSDLAAAAAGSDRPDLVPAGTTRAPELKAATG